MVRRSGTPIPAPIPAAAPVVTPSSEEPIFGEAAGDGMSVLVTVCVLTALVTVAVGVLRPRELSRTVLTSILPAERDRGFEQSPYRQEYPPPLAGSQAQMPV